MERSDLLSGHDAVPRESAEMRRRIDDPALDVTRAGDMITLDAFAGGLSVKPGALDGREPILPAAADRRGWPVLHRMHVTQAPQGCDHDFLRALEPDQVSMAEPVIGRS